MMGMSLGMALLWCGIGGMALSLIAGLICWILLRRKGRELLHAIEREYK